MKNRKYIIILIFLVIINLLIQKSINIKLNTFEYNFSKITLKIKGIGFSYIFGNDEEIKFENISYPNIIRINNII